jgi:hypothetical protein
MLTPLLAQTSAQRCCEEEEEEEALALAPG